MGDAPTIISEFGVAFDLDNRRAFTSGNFSRQIKAMDRSLVAMEDALVIGRFELRR